MKKMIWLAWAFGLLSLALSGCNKEFREANRAVRKGTIAEKDSAAFYFFRRGDCDKASFLLQDLQSAYRGTDRAKDILFTFARAKYNCNEFLVSAYYYEQFANLYPNDERAKEAAFMIGYSYYLISAPYYRDQTETLKTIEQMQLFIERFPRSDKVDEAELIMTEMREKLAKKEFETARLYYRLENFLAGVTSFEIMIQEYPDSRFREEAQFLLFMSAARLGQVSAKAKKRNRLLDALDYYQTFVDRYPNSEFLREAEREYARVRKELAEINAAANS